MTDAEISRNEALLYLSLVADDKEDGDSRAGSKVGNRCWSERTATYRQFLLERQQENRKRLGEEARVLVLGDVPFSEELGRATAAVSFYELLLLASAASIDVVQKRAFDLIQVKLRSASSSTSASPTGVALFPSSTPSSACDVAPPASSCSSSVCSTFETSSPLIYSSPISSPIFKYSNPLQTLCVNPQVEKNAEEENSVKSEEVEVEGEGKAVKETGGRGRGEE